MDTRQEVAVRGEGQRDVVVPVGVAGETPVVSPRKRSRSAPVAASKTRTSSLSLATTRLPSGLKAAWEKLTCGDHERIGAPPWVSQRQTWPSQPAETMRRPSAEYAPKAPPRTCPWPPVNRSSPLLRSHSRSRPYSATP